MRSGYVAADFMSHIKHGASIAVPDSLSVDARMPLEAARANTATDEYGQTFAILMLCVARGQSHAVDMQETLQAFPVHLMSVSDYARTALSR